MPPGGVDLLAHWREAGEWWAGGPPREIFRYIDEKGIRREEISKTNAQCGINPADLMRAEARAPSIDPRPGPSAALHVVSGYAFGKGTMFAGEIPFLAACKGYSAALLADPFSLAGAVEFWKSAEKEGIHALIGASFEMEDGGQLVLVARNATGYRSLSRLITECHMEEPRLFPLCNWDRLRKHSEGILCLTGGDDGPINRRLVSGAYGAALEWLNRLIALYQRENVFVEIERSYLPWQIALNRKLLQLAENLNLVAVAGGTITHDRPEHFPAQDMLVCIETLCLIDEIEGRKPQRDPSQKQSLYPPRRALNAERFLRYTHQLHDLYSDRLDLLANTMRVAERCERNVLPGLTQLPVICENEAEALREVTWTGALERYSKITKPLKRRIDFELDRIIRLEYSGHFLLAWDMCDWAKSQEIVLSGRGSVIDSVVAYCLGISRIDAYEQSLFFDRFLPADGSKRPDIDIDFEAKRRDDVRNYLSDKYGKEHVATVAAIGTYSTRGIVREVGKVMSIPHESLDYLTKRLHGSVSPDRLEREIDAKPELRNSNIPRERFHWVFQLAERLMEIPRNMRAHSSGVVLSKQPIADIVPVQHSGIETVPIIQWDKRSAKRCFDKFDVLCLRGNDVLGDTQRQVRKQEPKFSAENLPAVHDPEVYRTMRAGQLIGIPQSASPAMRQAHIRVQTQNLKDAGIVQAAIRPGVGGAVKLNEFIARRQGKPYSFVHPLLNEIIGKTYGIVVFQEQIDMLLQTFGGYSSDEAEATREKIHKKRRDDYALTIRKELTQRIIDVGFSRVVAHEVFDLVAGFQGYGFAEGHALAFAEISIRSVWCQQNYPAEYFAALLGAQPAGYYGPCTIANEARVRGVQILPPDANKSTLEFTVEDVQSNEDPKLVMPNGGIRVSLKQISGVSAATLERIVSARQVQTGGLYTSFFDFVARVKPDRDELGRLILCGFFDRLERNRRALLWAVPRALEHANLMECVQSALPLLLNEPPLPKGIQGFGEVDEAIYERSILGLDIEKHLMAFERGRVRSKGGLTAAEAGQLAHGTKSFVVGNPIRLRFPPTSSGRRVMFFDLQDETGLLNVTCFDDVYQRYGHAVICYPYITLFGESQVRDGHTAFLAERIIPFKPTLHSEIQPDEPLPIKVGDFLMT